MTRCVITYTGSVSRWQPDARERLERAALELFAQQGFAATTVPEITARAGLTTRTFFRHFADKREVLFAGEEIPAQAARMLADAPAGIDPVTLLFAGLRSVAETRFDGRRDEIRRRRDIIRSDDSLQERELGKRAALVAVIRTTFAGRGVAAAQAALLAEASITLFSLAIEQWLDQEIERPLYTVMLDTLDGLRATLATFPGAQFPPAPVPTPVTEEDER